MQLKGAHNPVSAGGWWLALGWLLVWSVSCAFAAEEGAVLLAAPADLSSQPGDRLVPFDVTINGVNTGTWLFLERGEVLHATADAFESWRIAPDPAFEAILFRDQVFHSVNNIPGFTRTVDLNNQSLVLEFAPEVFAATHLGRYVAQVPEPSPVLTSLFLNYDLNYSMSRQAEGISPTDLSTLAELGFSTGLGVLTTSVIGSNLTGYINPAIDPTLAVGEELGRSVNRLESTFTRDFPKRKLTLRMGDTYTKPGMLGRGVYFGGVSIGSNFGLNPSFIRQPLSPVTGLSASPSTVELYVNDVLRQVSSVPAGPFAIDNFPTLSGNGTARIIVRDQLGRETVVEQSFLTNSELLAKGVSDWSLEAGRVRNELGTAESDYGEQFYGGFLRRGLRDTTTVEGRLEVLPALSNVSVGLVSELPFLLLGRAAVSSSSHAVLGRGQQVLLGIEYQGTAGSGVVEVQTASENYRQLGQGNLILPTKRQLVTSWSYGNEHVGAFSVGLARLERYEGPSVTTMSASYTRRIGGRSSISVVASRAQSANSAATSSLSLNLVVPLGKNRSSNSYASTRGGQYDLSQSLSQNVGPDNKLGWRMMAGRMTDRSRIEAGVNYAGRYGSVTGDVGHNAGNTFLRLGSNSSLVFADGSLFASRSIDHSFAVVEIEGFKDIGVGVGSHVTAYTNKRGKALIPRLAAYQSNAVQLDPSALPITAGIDSIEEVVVPSYRSAVKITFPVRAGRGALIKVVMNGEPAPLGALVNIKGESEAFFVARRGEAFVTGLQDTTSMILNWRGQTCEFEVKLPPEESEEIPRVGPFVCQEADR